jgi:uncharacterized protein (TIGR02118 family)
MASVGVMGPDICGQKPSKNRQERTGMFKTMFTIYFPEGMDREAAREHWRTTHKDVVLKCEGVVKYIQDHKVGEFPGGDDLEGAKQWDGIAELFFKDKETWERVMDSPEWEVVMEDSYNFINMELVGAGLVEEEHIV